MKSNRKARKQRKLNYQETQRKRLAILLTQMEQAAGEVLQDLFGFTLGQVDFFLESARTEMSAEPAQIEYNPLHPQRHLTTTAQKFALVGMGILKKNHAFDQKQLDSWLGALIAAGNRQRQPQS